MSKLNPEQRKKMMQRFRSKNTLPELLIMQELKQRKIYFAKHVNNLVGKPDIVFRRKKIVVFIDSDFWHGHPKRLRMPKTNLNYWTEKIAKNKRRDRQVNRQLKVEGWKVIRLWEGDIKKDMEKCLARILNEYFNQS